MEQSVIASVLYIDVYIPKVNKRKILAKKKHLHVGQQQVLNPLYFYFVPVSYSLFMNRESRADSIGCTLCLTGSLSL